jgi:hypothetical protein
MKIAILLHRPFLLLMVFCLCSQIVPASSINAKPKFKDHIAIIKIAYEGFEPDLQRQINVRLDTAFAKEALKRYKTQESTREELQLMGILAETLRHPQHYRRARDTLRIKHAIVIDFEQLGPFVHGLVRLFSVDLLQTYEYPIGTTVDSLHYEIQRAAREILRLIPPKPKKRWPYIVAGAGGVSLITAYLVFGPEDRKELPKPPDLPDLP